MKYIAKVGVKVSPETKQFDATMARIEGKKRKTVFDVLLNDKLAQARKKALEKPARFRLEVDANTKGIADAKTRIQTLAEELKAIQSQSWVRVRAEAQTAQAEADMEKLRVKMAIVQDKKKIQVDVDMERNRVLSRIKALESELENVQDTGDNPILLKMDIADAEHSIRELDERFLSAQFFTENEAELQLDVDKAERRLEGLHAQVERGRLEMSRATEIRLDISKAAHDIRSFKAEIQRMRRVLGSGDAIQLEFKLRIRDAELKLNQIHTQIEYLKKNATAVVKMDTAEARGKVETLREQLTKLKDVTKQELQLDVDRAQREVTRLRAELRKVTDEEVRITLNSQLDEALREVAALRTAVKNPMSVEIQANLDALTEAEEQLARVTRNREAEIAAEVTGLEMQRAKMEKFRSDMQDELDITANLDIDAKAARAELFWVTRDRITNILVRVTGVNEANRVLKGLTGVAMMERFRDSIINAASNLDTMARKIMLTGSSVAYLASMLISAVPAVLAFLHGFVQIAPLTLSTVAVLGSLGFAIMTTTMAFRDLGNASNESAREFRVAWTELQDSMKGVKKTIQDGFFTSETVANMRRLSGTIVPQLNAGLGALAATLGSTFTGVLDQLATDLQDGQLLEFLQRVDEGFQHGKEGTLAFASGITQLGLTAAKYLPDIGAWVTDTGNKFRDWVQEPGNVVDAIDTAIKQFGLLSEGLKGLTGSMGAILDATGFATDGFQGFRDAMVSFETWLRNAHIQQGLEDLFAGAGAAASGLTARLGDMRVAVGEAFSNTGAILEAFGGAFEELVAGIILLLSNDEFRDGMVSLGEGIEQAFKDVDWANLGATIGAVADDLKETLPGLVELFNELVDVLPDVSSALSDFSQAVTPIVADLAPILPLLLGVVGAFSLISGAVRLLSPVVTILQGLGSSAGGATGGFALLRSAFSILAGPVGIIIGVILLLAAAVIYLWNNNEEFRERVTRIWEKIKEAVQTFLDWWEANVAPRIEPVLEGLKTGFQTFMDIVGIIFNGLLIIIESWLNFLLDIVLPAVLIFVEFLIQNFENLKEKIGAVWDWIKEKIAAWVESLREMVDGLAVIIMPIIETFQAFGEAVGGVIDKLMGKNDELMAKNGEMAGNTESSWAGMSASISNHSSQMSSIGSANVEDLRNRVGSSMSGMASDSSGTLSGWSSTSTGHATAMGNGVADAVAAGLARALDAIHGFASSVTSATAGWGGLGSSAGASIGDGIVAGLNSRLTMVGAAAAALMAAAAVTMPQSPAKKGPFSGHGWTTYRGKAIVDGLIQGMTAQAPALANAAERVMQAGSDKLDFGGTNSAWPSLIAPRVGTAGASAGTPLNITVSPVVDPAKSMRDQTERSLEAAFDTADRRLARYA